MERAEHQVELGERRRVHIALPVVEHIHLDRAQHPERGAVRLELVVHRVDPRALVFSRTRVLPVRDRAGSRSGR